MNLNNSDQQKHLNWALHAAGSLAVALLLTTFYQLGYAQLADQDEAYANRTEQLERLLATFDSVKHKHQSLRQELDQLEQEAAVMHRRLPYDLQKGPFESSVHKAASEVGVRLENATWSMPRFTPSHSLAEVTVDGVGSFASICKFLSKIDPDYKN